MFESILNCKKCGLCNNQDPQIGNTTYNCDVMWIGLSAKMDSIKAKEPISPYTYAGRLISSIEKAADIAPGYKTNLVKCPPLDESGEVRKPTEEEIRCCSEHVLEEINRLQPKIVFLMGTIVLKEIERIMNLKFKKWEYFNFYATKINNIYFIPIQHPTFAINKGLFTKMAYEDSVIDILTETLQKIQSD